MDISVATSWWVRSGDDGADEDDDDGHCDRCAFCPVCTGLWTQLTPDSPLVCMKFRDPTPPKTPKISPLCQHFPGASGRVCLHPLQWLVCERTHSSKHSPCLPHNRNNYSNYGIEKTKRNRTGRSLEVHSSQNVNNLQQPWNIIRLCGWKKCRSCWRFGSNNAPPPRESRTKNAWKTKQKRMQNLKTNTRRPTDQHRYALTHT